MSKAQLVITAVVLEGRSESEVARDYDVSRYCVQQLVKRYETEGVAAFEHTPAAPTTIPGRPAPSSRKRLCGCAKPWTNKVPGGRHATVVLDIANTGVARGKVYAARERGERLPDGWAIDASGLPTNDPQAALDGLILPMSGHKGYAISFMMDVLSGVLTGSAFGADVVGPYGQTSAADAGTW